MNIRKPVVVLLTAFILSSCTGNFFSNSREVYFFGRLAYAEYDISSGKPAQGLNDSRKKISGNIEICFHLKKANKVKCNRFDSKFLKGGDKRDDKIGKNFFYFREFLQDISIKSISLNNGTDKFAFKKDSAKVSDISTKDQMVYLGDILLTIDTNYRDSKDYVERYKNKMTYDDYMSSPYTGKTKVGLLSKCNKKVASTIESAKGIPVHNECFKLGGGIHHGRDSMTYFLEIPRVE